MGMGRMGAVAAILLASLALAQSAAAQAPVKAPGQDDYCGAGCFDVLPPGTKGNSNLVELGTFLATGNRPRLAENQRDLYGDLIYDYRNLTRASLDRHFKRHNFGVPPEQVERSYSPHPDVTVIRDAEFGIPHIYSTSRAGAMFASGYVAAEDRLFVIDALRHVGRAELTPFVGGAEGNRALERDQWEVAPYTEADFQRQFDQFDNLYGEEGREIQQDAVNYTAGVNAFIQEARLDPTKLPAEYPALDMPEGPEDWKVTDIIATAALVGGIFGKGGGNELRNALVLERMVDRFGALRGRQTFREFRSAEHPDQPTTVHETLFPYQRPPRPRERGVALPDRGSVRFHEIIRNPEGSAAASSRSATERSPDAQMQIGPEGLFGTPRGFDSFPQGGSNALLVSGTETRSGRPIAVFGPQTGQFAPNLLMEFEVQAPGLSAKGAAFAGTNLYVQLGRGQDYAWSATSAGQDIIDTFAVPLCEPDGSQPTTESMHYLFRGHCIAIEVLEKRNSWEPNPGDSTPEGSYTLRAERTKMGLVEARATERGRPVIYTKLRSTYMHEIDSAPGFSDFNNPDRIRSASDFMRAAHKIGYTFNWFYADANDIAYFNSGWNPVRHPRQNNDLPVHSRVGFEWRDWDPEAHTMRLTPFSEHPQVINQPYLTSWNNKQARAYRASDAQWGFQSTYRSKPLDTRIRALTQGDRKTSLEELVWAMEDSAVVDLRAEEVLRYPLAIIGDQPTGDAELDTALNHLRAWRQGPVEDSLRIDRNRDGSYEHAEAIRIMDAWWPLWLEAQFKPVLGEEAYEAVRSVQGQHNPPRGDGGSAFQGGWYGYARQDLRQVLNLNVRGRWHRSYCGGGDRGRCREVLLSSLKAALQIPESEIYETNRGECEGTIQYCHDATEFSALGGITHPKIHWHNRPTYQQVVEFERKR